MATRYEVKTHGYGAYTNGCRCDVCREAKATRAREYREEKRRALRLVKARGGRNFVRGIVHGYSGYQNHCCRCPVCTTARAASDRARYLRRTS